MKIRNGFVSNSSSSSFMIVAKKKAVEEVLRQFPQTYRQFIEEILPQARACNLGGVDCVTYCTTLNSEWVYEMGQMFLPAEDVDGSGDIFDSFIDQLNAHKDAVAKYGD